MASRKPLASAARVRRAAAAAAAPTSRIVRGGGGGGGGPTSNVDHPHGGDGGFHGASSTPAGRTVVATTPRYYPASLVSHRSLLCGSIEWPLENFRVAELCDEGCNYIMVVLAMRATPAPCAKDWDEALATVTDEVDVTATPFGQALIAHFNVALVRHITVTLSYAPPDGGAEERAGDGGTDAAASAASVDFRAGGGDAGCVEDDVERGADSVDEDAAVGEDEGSAKAAPSHDGGGSSRGRGSDTSSTYPTSVDGSPPAKRRRLHSPGTAGAGEAGTFYGASLDPIEPPVVDTPSSSSLFAGATDGEHATSPAWGCACRRDPAAPHRAGAADEDAEELALAPSYCTDDELSALIDLDFLVGQAKVVVSNEPSARSLADELICQVRAASGASLLHRTAVARAFVMVLNPPRKACLPWLFAGATPTTPVGAGRRGLPPTLPKLAAEEVNWVEGVKLVVRLARAHGEAAAVGGASDEAREELASAVADEDAWAGKIKTGAIKLPR